MSASISLVLCRHTQTHYDAAGKYIGQQHVEPNATGIAQANRLADRIARLPGIVAIVSSDLAHAVYLTNQIGHRTGIPSISRRGLREMKVGELTGLTHGEARARFPHPAYNTNSPFCDLRNIGGECLTGVVERQKLVLAKTIRGAYRADGPTWQRVVVVGHEIALRMLFGNHLGSISELHRPGEFQEVPLEI